MLTSSFRGSVLVLLAVVASFVEAAPKKRGGASGDGLIINVPANTCQDVFDYFPDICNSTVQFSSRKNNAATIGCNINVDSCGSEQTFCSIYDCCNLAYQQVGTCGNFFDTVGTKVCTDNGFNDTMVNNTLCASHPKGCGLESCCGTGDSTAQSCQALFAFYENPYGQKSNMSYNGTYSCNFNDWFRPKANYTNITSETGEFVRNDCCDAKQTCGLAYDRNNGTGATLCSNAGFSFSQRSDVQCDPFNNSICDLNACCFIQSTCRAFNFINKNNQTSVCKSKGYGYAQPVSTTPCTNGVCKHRECCVRQDKCAAYFADDSKVCQKQGYSYNRNGATVCAKGVCSAPQCCTVKCPTGGFSSVNKTCNNV